MPVFLRVVALFALTHLATAATAADVDYLHQLQAQAATLKLADAREWQVLLHYENGWSQAQRTSTVTTSWFFNAVDGATNPQAELDATLAAFFRTDALQPRDETAQCMFTARYQWLKTRLDFDPARLPEQDCSRFQVWIEALGTDAVTMVFPAAYLNSPASMFGHTLLRLDGGRRAQQNELLAYAVNFAAETDEDNGLVFAVRGLTGGYPGNFGIYPYYEKVKEYARIENRDLWEYQLLLEPVEIGRMLRHLWELRGVTFDYYFLKYNCSYQLLALLESARPELALVNRFRGWAIPTDTLRILRETPGLVGQIEYRPAMSTQLANEAASLSDAQTEQVLQWVHDGRVADAAAVQAASPQDQARSLQVAHDYLYYQYQGQRMPRDEALPRAREILLARSKLGGTTDFPPVPRPDTAPDEGHATRRLSMGVINAGGHTALSLRLRPAYHDLLDPAAGYGTGAQIRFLDVGLSIDVDSGDARLEDLRAIDVISVAPRDALFKPISWRFGTGLRRPLAPILDEGAPGLGWYFEGGPGLAWGSAAKMGYVYALGSLDLNRDLAQDYSAGLGAAAGLLLQPRPQWGLLLELGTMERLWGQEDHEYWASLGQQWQLNPAFGLRLELEHRDTEQQSWGHIGLSGQWYF